MRRILLVSVFSLACCQRVAAQVPPRGRDSSTPLLPPKSKCQESRPEDIVRSFGRIWGNVSEQRGIGSHESRRIKDKLMQYQLCVAVENRQASVCDGLESIDLSHFYGKGTMASECRGLYAGTQELLFFSFLAGHEKDPGVCREYFNSIDWRDPLGMTEDIFCKAAEMAVAKKGMEDFCSFLCSSAALPKELAGKCRTDCPRSFSTSPKDCASGSECSQRLQIYRAVVDRKPQACPSASKIACTVVINRIAGNRCAKAAKDLENTYCGLYRAAEKRTRGQVGITDESSKGMEELNRGIRKMRGGGETSPGDSEETSP